MPAGEDAVGLEFARGLVDRRREAYADAEQAVTIDARAAERVTNKLVGEVEAFDWRMIDLGRRPVVDDGLSRQVADGDADVLMAEVVPTANAASGTSESRMRRSPGIPRRGIAGDAALLDHTGSFELLDDRRNRLPGEAGAPRDVGSARRGVAVDRLDHAQPVELTNAERTRAGGHFSVLLDKCVVDRSLVRDLPRSREFWVTRMRTYD